MLGSPRKRSFGLINSASTTHSSYQQRDEDNNPWFRDPTFLDRDLKIRKSDHRPSHSRQSPPSQRDSCQNNKSDFPHSAPSQTSQKSHPTPSTTINPNQEVVKKVDSTAPLDDTVEDGEIPEGIVSSDHSPPRRSHSIKSDQSRSHDRPRDSDRERHRHRDRSSRPSHERGPSWNRIRQRHRERDVESDRERDYLRDSRAKRERRKDYDHDYSRFTPPPYSGRKRSPDRDHPRRRHDEGERLSRYYHDGRHRHDSERKPRNKTPDPSEKTAPSRNNSKQQDDDDEAQGVTEPKPQLTEDEILEQARRKRAEILAKHKQLNQTINPSDVFAMTTDPSVSLSAATIAGSAQPSKTSAAIDTLMANPDHTFPSHEPFSKEIDQNSPAIRIREDSGTPLPIRGVSEQGSDSIPASPEPVADTNFDLTQDANNKIALTSTGDDSSLIKYPLDQSNITGLGHQSISAADYNPDNDRRIDNERQHEKQIHGYKALEGLVSSTHSAENYVAHGKSEGGDEEEEEEDEDDMFAIDSSEKKKTKRNKPANVTHTKESLNPSASFLPVINRAATDVEVVDNFDDADGYYRVILGELLDNGRYHVHANLGKGMFASVVRAKDMTVTTEGQNGRGRDVAIKVVRSQESMFKSSQKEASILKKLQETDPTGKYHIIRLDRTFEHRGHFCLVFEAMGMNLRELVKRFGKDVGINLRAVRAYAHQILLALSLMKKCNIMHADLKPDNILVSETKSVLKVCDLGSASDVTENEITPYLVSRFYRAPEIILGLPYDCSIDIWSIGCTLYELYTGKILFPGRSNNHLLLLIMELKGRFNSKLLKKAKFSNVHFDDDNGNFLSIEKNRITGADVVKSINIPNKPTQGLQSRLMPNHVTKKMQDADVRLLSAFVDLLEKILTLEPSRRITPKEALNHPFIRGI